MMDAKVVNLEIDEITERIKDYSIHDKEHIPGTLHEEILVEDLHEEERSDLKCNGVCDAHRLTKKGKNKASSAVPAEIIVSVEQKITYNLRTLRSLLSQLPSCQDM